MKTEHGIRGKFGYALGFALAAGIALTTALTAHAQPADATLPCPLGAACPPLCTPSTTCGPVDDTTVTGSFIRQKPNGACVYLCSGTQTCTEQDENCSMFTFTQTASFRRRMVFPAGACPMDDASATFICVNGETE